MSGFVGSEIAERYKRVFQVHVREDFLSPYLKEAYGKWSIMFGKFVLKHSHSLRASTETIRDRLLEICTHTKDISVLPKFVDIQSLISSAKTDTSAPDIFPQFSFVILFVGVLDHESTLFRALDAARSALFSKAIGMVVLGEGPAKSEFQKRAEILGIQEQVVFKSDADHLNEYLSSADILICTDTTETSDEVIVKAAASGLPILAAENHFRTDLFTDGESAFICPKEDTVCFSQKLIKFLNSNALRTQFASSARDIVSTRLSEDPEVYKEAYRNSIESVFETQISN
jgi:glycosyltransferase involved in cell wall biosynthesis